MAPPPVSTVYRMKSVLAAVSLLLAAAQAPAADSDDKPVTGFQFELLPRAFQKKPLVDVHVITEMTAAGRTQPVPTAAQPAYYLTRPAGQLTLGQGAPANEKPADVARLEQLMAASLAVSHYLPAKDGQEPKLVIIYSWGSHSAPLGQDDPSYSEETTDDGTTTRSADTGESQETLIREIIERAKLVGGDKFAAELIKAINQEAAMRRATPENSLDVLASPLGPVSFGLMSPMEQFRNRNPKTMGMLEDIGGSIYFVIASAYDAASVAANKRVLLWRTKMTTRATGLNLAESMPSLIVTAGPYFGKDMDESESIRRRLSRDGTVELGPLKIIGVEENAAPSDPVPPAPAKTPEPPKKN